MNRKKLLLLNTVTSLFSQGATVICGFILTRFVLSFYGSEVNGLVSSISQFLGFISFLEMGIGAVAKAALYKPLADKNYDEVSKVIVSTKKFYKTIAKIILIYTGVLTLIFPLLSYDKFSLIYTGSLVIIIAISLFAQYYFGMPYQLMLNADQKSFIPTTTCCITLILNTVLSALLMYFGASIQIVKLTTSIVYVLRPMVYCVYVKRKYPLNEKIVITEEPLKQKWNGLAQHIAYVVVNYTDIVVLTLMSTLANVSIYTVYHNVTIGIQQVISCVSVGISAMIGNVLYSEKKEQLQETFELVEWFFHLITVGFFVITGILIIPFVQLYTSGISDANYYVPGFAILITWAQAAYSIRIPYETIVLSANHFKQTQKSAIIEVIINIGISVLLVLRFGIVGVAIGTLAAMTYRTLYFVFYLKGNILDYRIAKFVKLIIVDVIQICIIIGVFGYMLHFNSFIQSWVQFFARAFALGVGTVIICLLVQVVCYRDLVLRMIKLMQKRKK